MIEHTFFRFALVGLANTAVGYGTILLLHYSLGWSPTVANAGGYAVGVLLSYSINRTFTFNSSRSHVQAVPRFVVAAAGSFMLNLLVLHASLSTLGLPVGLAQALAVGSYTVAFYLSNRFLVFRDQQS